MSLVIAKAICRREFGADRVPEQFAEVLRRSMAIDLATAIKGSGLPPATKLLKIYATSPEGARRIVHLLVCSLGASSPRSHKGLHFFPPALTGLTLFGGLS